MLFLCYPRCATCKKAEAWLDEAGIEYTFRDIRTTNPSKAELKKWRDVSKLPLKSFFNTSGLQYKALGLSQKLAALGEEEQLDLLASDGMLVKRPILAGEGFVLVGFKIDEWEARLK